MSLIDTWLKAGKASGLKTNTAVLMQLNKDLGLNIQTNKIYEWRSGKQRPPIEVANYMIQESVVYAVQQLKPRFRLTSAEQCLLVSLLSMPKKDND